MFRFSTAGEAAAALAAIDADYELHCRSARRIAETWFDAKQVLQDVLNVALHQERRKPHPAVSTR